MQLNDESKRLILQLQKSAADVMASGIAQVSFLVPYFFYYFVFARDIHLIALCNNMSKYTYIYDLH